jgi:hypothetical protein
VVRVMMGPPLWHLRCHRCERVHALPHRQVHCPRCLTGRLTPIDATEDAAVAYFAGTMR